MNFDIFLSGLEDVQVTKLDKFKDIIAFHV